MRRSDNEGILKKEGLAKDQRRMSAIGRRKADG
jgi:hypothetical protein